MPVDINQKKLSEYREYPGNSSELNERFVLKRDYSNHPISEIRPENQYKAQADLFPVLISGSQSL